MNAAYNNAAPHMPRKSSQFSADRKPAQCHVGPVFPLASNRAKCSRYVAWFFWPMTALYKSTETLGGADGGNGSGGGAAGGGIPGTVSVMASVKA